MARRVGVFLHRPQQCARPSARAPQSRHGPGAARRAARAPGARRAWPRLRAGSNVSDRHGAPAPTEAVDVTSAPQYAAMRRDFETFQALVGIAEDFLRGSRLRSAAACAE